MHKDAARMMKYVYGFVSKELHDLSFRNERQNMKKQIKHLQDESLHLMSANEELSNCILFSQMLFRNVFQKLDLEVTVQMENNHNSCILSDALTLRIKRFQQDFEEQMHELGALESWNSKLRIFAGTLFVLVIVFTLAVFFHPIFKHFLAYDVAYGTSL